MLSPRRPNFRVYSLDDQRLMKKRRGGNFRSFLRKIGHASRPLLRSVESGIRTAMGEKFGRDLGKKSLKFGSKILSDITEKKMKQLLDKGDSHINTKLFGGGGRYKHQIETGLSPDISNQLYPENKKKVAKLFRKKRKGGKKGVKLARGGGGGAATWRKRHGGSSRKKKRTTKKRRTKGSKGGSKTTRGRSKKSAVKRKGGKRVGAKRIGNRKKGGGRVTPSPSSLSFEKVPTIFD